MTVRQSVVEQRRAGVVAVDSLDHQHGGGEGPGRRGRVGLLRRVENLVRNTEDYRQQVQQRYEHAVRRIDGHRRLAFLGARVHSGSGQEGPRSVDPQTRPVVALTT